MELGNSISSLTLNLWVKSTGFILFLQTDLGESEG